MTMQRDLPPFSRTEIDVERKVAARLSEGRLDVLAMPQVVMKVLGLVDSQDATMTEIAREVATDQGIATHILALANSAFYRGTVHITSIEQAVIRIGLRELKGAVLLISLKNVFRSDAYPELSRALWEHSLATALVANRVGPLAGTDAQEVFTAALVHDVGKIAVLALYDKYVTAEDAPHVSEEVLAHILDDYHVEAGRLLARDWELPATAAEAIITHHADPYNGIHGREARVVALSNKLANIMGFSSPGSKDFGENVDGLCRELGIDAEMQVALIEETPAILAELEAVMA